MYSGELRLLKETLMRGGVLPAVVGRTLSELEDHFEDLEAEALRAGYRAGDASAEAMARLGSGSVIAREILKRDDLKSWAFRWPWVPAALRRVVILTSHVSLPNAMIFTRGTVVARWCVSTGLATLLTGGLLLLMTRMISVGFPL